MSLIYPRTLQEEVSFKGETMLKITCADPFECNRKCSALERTAREGGLPAPVTCALCDPPCPDNPGTSFVQTVHAFVDDVASAIKLAMICMDPVACTCQILMMIRPAWIDDIAPEVRECSVSDIFMMLLDKITIILLSWLEWEINTSDLYQDLNNFIKNLPKLAWEEKNNGLPWICFEHRSYKDNALLKKCNLGDGDEMVEVLACDPAHSFAETRSWRQCYYNRVESICGQANPAYAERYEQLFSAPSQGDLQAEFTAILGDAFTEIDPATRDMFENLENADRNNAAASICKDNVAKVRTIELDEMIISCIFHQIEKFCPEGKADDDIQTFFREVEWQLPKAPSRNSNPTYR